MRAIRVQITPDFMRELMVIPLTADIVGASWADGNVELVIESVGFPEVAEGARLPLATPVFRKQASVILVDWGIPQDQLPIGSSR